MNVRSIFEPAPVLGDEHEFAGGAFRRAQAVYNHGDIENLDELRGFLQAEADECARKASYLRSMSKYFHENAAVAQEMEAKAMLLMLESASS